MLKKFMRAILFVFLALASLSSGTPGLAASEKSNQQAIFPTSPQYTVEFVSTAASGIAMNDAGVVTGISYPDPGCGSFCLPTQETVVWRGSERIVLPGIPGLSGITVSSINNQGWIAGYAGFPGTTTHAVVWVPDGSTYQAIDLGTLPGTSTSYAVGIDNQGRVIGWSSTLNFPPQGSPFLWTEAGGMIDLTALGYPDEAPLAISPAGAVATPGYWYRLDDPSSVVSMSAVPQGFYPPGTYATAINDLGDQARFLISTGGQNLAYLFRYQHAGTWQKLSNLGNGNLLPFGIGSINNAGTITATLQGNAVIAHGPTGLARPLSAYLSPAYRDVSVTLGGPMNGAGDILAKVIIGRSQRLVRLVLDAGCSGGCMRVNALTVTAEFIQDPQNPGLCFEGGSMYNQANATVTVKNRAGVPLSGVTVSGRFLDDYWTDAPVSGITNQQGVVSFDYSGLCGVGAIAFLVDDLDKAGMTFEKMWGSLTGWDIP